MRYPKYYYDEKGKLRGDVKRNPLLMLVNPPTEERTVTKLKRHPEFRKALKLYRKFHGESPTSVTRHILPVGDPERIEGSAVLVGIGKSPASSYFVPKKQKSRKGDSIYVHPFEEGNEPDKAVTADGRMIVELPGEYEVTDWIRDRRKK